MFNSFIQFIKDNGLIKKGQRVLLAISGGMDSMVLLQLFEKSGFDYGVVHCNFKLRGDESDEDESFVKRQVLIHGVPAFFKSFDTREYAEVSGISIEMAARELRYEYFEEVRKENKFDLIATAHHQDDQFETFFLNLSRKTGIKGLTGIKKKAGRVIRPLLFANRKQVKEYCQEKFIEYREDSSNSELIYQRNFVRHQIIPLFEELNPAFKKNLVSGISNLRETEEFYMHFLQTEINKVCLPSEDGAEIRIQDLLKVPFPRLVLFEILQTYHFNPTVVYEVYQGLESSSGKKYYSKTHRLVKDRESLFVSKVSDEDEKIYYIEKDDLELFDPMDLIIEKIHMEDFSMIRDSKVACIDLDKIRFPLLMRPWHQGDYFRPLGMEGFKKVSDFFIDQKVPIHIKEKTWILCSGEQIVWIMGMRLDDRFKVTEETLEVLEIQIKQ